ncbi:hypothetical protein Tco_0218071 [Tanacetum coccineum]
MSEFDDSSVHNNSRRRMMTPKQEEFYPWEQPKSSDVDICMTFLKLCIVEDTILDKISSKLEEPLRNTHVDEYVCCQVQHMTEENVHAFHTKMQEIHASINNDLKIPNGKLTHVGLAQVYMFVACVVLCLLVARCSQEYLKGDTLNPWIIALEQGEQ